MIACRTTAPSIETNQKDSVAVSEHISWEDTTVQTAPDSASISFPWSILYPTIEKDTVLVAKGNRNASVKVIVSKEKITATANCDSVESKLRLAQKEITRFHLQQTSEIKTIREPFVPGFIKFLAWTGGASILLGIIFLILKIRK
jgi:hypothetical protein